MIVADNLSVDNSVPIALDAGALVILESEQGKGQAVMRGLNLVTSTRVILCDADLRGIQTAHISDLLRIEPDFAMTIAIPDFTLNLPWARDDRNWVLCSGERILSTALLRTLDLHGYAMEMQINKAVAHEGLAVREIQWAGVAGAPKDQNLRMADMLRDWEWIKSQ